MSKDICKIFGDNLYKIRIVKNLTQEELGFEVDLSDRAIAHYEKGRRCPSLRTANKIANALGIELAEMIK